MSLPTQETRIDEIKKRDDSRHTGSKGVGLFPSLPGNHDLSHRDFKKRQREYFAGLLERKWECDIPGHTICVPTKDGQHLQFSEDKFTLWVNALCLGDATTAQPPDGVLECDDIDALSNHADLSRPIAVSVPPTHRRDIRSPTLAATASLRESLTDSSISKTSSGALGPGYYTGKAMLWLGERVLDALEDVIILKRAYHHRYVLARWKKQKGMLTMKRQKELFKILEDALEMSRACYSSRINRCATSISWRIEHWAREHLKYVPTKGSASYLGRIFVCVSTLDVAARSNLSTDDFSWELLDAVTKVPLALQDSGAISAVIRILGRELAYSPYYANHPWLGNDLIDIIEATLQMRDLTQDEISSIREIAVRRLEQVGTDTCPSCRPWEVAIFTECASQDPWFRAVVQGPHGLPTVFSALDIALSRAGINQEESEEWSHLDDVHLALHWLTRHRWVAMTVEPKTTHSLLNVFRHRIPKRWFCIRCGAVLVVRNIVSHQPTMLRILIQENIMSELASFILAPIPREAPGNIKGLKDQADDAARSLLKEVERWSAHSAPLWKPLLL